jgi:hypothetical protein
MEWSVSGSSPSFSLTHFKRNSFGLFRYWDKQQKDYYCVNNAIDKKHVSPPQDAKIT